MANDYGTLSVVSAFKKKLQCMKFKFLIIIDYRAANFMKAWLEGENPEGKEEYANGCTNPLLEIWIVSISW